MGIIPMNIEIVSLYAVYLDDETEPLVVCDDRDRAQEYVKYFSKMLFGNPKLTIRAKLMAHPGYLTMLKNTNLPLKHYYNYGGKVVEDGKSQWMLDYMDKIRTHLQGK